MNARETIARVVRETLTAPSDRWGSLLLADRILAALAAAGQTYEDGVRAAADKCLDVEWEKVGEPVKWKDIRWTFYHLIRGAVYDPILGIWNEPAAPTTGGDA